MVSWLNALSRTRNRISSALAKVFSRSDRIDAATLEELEIQMIQADMPVRIVESSVKDLQAEPRDPPVPPREVLKRLLVRTLGPADTFSWAGRVTPLAILVVGINGSGKTTTCAKLARRVQAAGLKPLLGAGDTFRAAGSHQLQLWADQVGCAAVAGATGADAAAVAFDAVNRAVADGFDALIFDTAGRMHTKAPLMQELQKVRRAMAKRLPDAPHETWIVLDASMGQNAVTQARMFHDATPLTGVIVSKLDGSAKAGFLFAIRREIGAPIRFVGLGEGADDLVPFDPEAFVDGLLGAPDEASGTA
jgi:fused signal recognition particle receptor